MIYDAIIIGAGASGLIAAGRVAELNGKVLLLEKMPRPGKKLLITGKGRCNITNTASKEEYLKRIFSKPRFLQHSFNRFFVDDIITLMEKYGVHTKVERGGRIFPESDQASDVVDALLEYCDNSNVTMLTNADVKEILSENGIVTGVRYNYQGSEKKDYAKNIILTTGGASYPATGSTGDGYKLAKSLGHKITETYPALVPINTQGNLAKKLMGLSLKNSKAVVRADGKKVAEEFGELLFTHFGLSGPIILTLSRTIIEYLKKNQKVEVSIDLKPALDDVKLDKRLLRDIEENKKKKLDKIFKLWLPAKLIPVFMELVELDPDSPGHSINAKQRKKIRLLMKNLNFQVSGHRPLKEAIITAGGVSVKEITSKTMESKIVSNLYFAGEIIDLDAETGGYNLQIAYSTAYLAAVSIMEN